MNRAGCWPAGTAACRKPPDRTARRGARREGRLVRRQHAALAVQRRSTPIPPVQQTGQTRARRVRPGDAWRPAPRSATPTAPEADRPAVDRMAVSCDRSERHRRGLARDSATGRHESTGQVVRLVRQRAARARPVNPEGSPLRSDLAGGEVTGLRARAACPGTDALPRRRFSLNRRPTWTFQPSLPTGADGCRPASSCPPPPTACRSASTPSASGPCGSSPTARSPKAAACASIGGLPRLAAAGSL